MTNLILEYISDFVNKNYTFEDNLISENDFEIMDSDKNIIAVVDFVVFAEVLASPVGWSYHNPMETGEVNFYLDKINLHKLFNSKGKICKNATEKFQNELNNNLNEIL